MMHVNVTFIFFHEHPYLKVSRELCRLLKQSDEG